MIANLPSKETRLRAYRGWIERICLNYSITATNIASRIGVSPSTITRQIKQDWTKEPQIEILLRISFAFLTPLPPEFLGHKNNSKNSPIIDKMDLDLDTSNKYQKKSYEELTIEIQNILLRLEVLEAKLNNSNSGTQG